MQNKIMLRACMQCNSIIEILRSQYFFVSILVHLVQFLITETGRASVDMFLSNGSNHANCANRIRLLCYKFRNKKLNHSNKHCFSFQQITAFHFSADLVQQKQNLTVLSHSLISVDMSHCQCS